MRRRDSPCGSRLPVHISRKIFTGFGVHLPTASSQQATNSRPSPISARDARHNLAPPGRAGTQKQKGSKRRRRDTPLLEGRSVPSPDQLFQPLLFALRGQRPPAECRQVDQIVRRHGFRGLARLAPRSKPSNDHERIESLFPQRMRHTGAGGFTRSSTVKVDIFILGQLGNFLGEVVRLETD